MNAINHVLFDLGNVLLKFNFNRTRDRWVEFGADEAAVESPAMTKLKIAYESGRLSDDAFVDEAMKISGYGGPRASFVDAWQDIFEENHPMLRRLERLVRNGLPCFLLSNSNGMHVRHIRERYDVFNHFQDCVFSHDVKSMKPDDAIFEKAIERFAIRPEKTLYIDDLAANIEAGRRFGFQCLHYDYRNDGEAASRMDPLLARR